MPPTPKDQIPDDDIVRRLENEGIALIQIAGEWAGSETLDESDVTDVIASTIEELQACVVKLQERKAARQLASGSDYTYR